MNATENLFGVWASSEGWVLTKRGWPDFFCRRGHELMAVEVKDRSDWLTVEQRAALIDLHGAGIATFIWTPAEGLMAYPTVQETTRVDHAALAWELIQARAELDRVTGELEIARTQLAPVIARANEIEASVATRMQRAAGMIEELAEYLLHLDGVPPEVRAKAASFRHAAYPRLGASRKVRARLDRSVGLA